MHNVFFAYGNEPKSTSETIETAIANINQCDIFNIKSWRDINISGKYVIDEICSEIEKCDIFACELTTLNFNVIFELGYALSQMKSVKIFLDPTIENRKRQFDTLGLFTTIGYVPYSNSKQIFSEFFNVHDINNNQNLVDDTLDFLPSSDTISLLYVKSPIETDASIKLSRIIDEQKYKKTVDDPKEVKCQTFPWYIQNIFNSNGVIAHLLDEGRVDNIIHNAKASFICGLAYGFNMPVLMLAHSPFDPPADYRNILKVHTTASECSQFATNWFEKTKEKLVQNRNDTRISKEQIKAISDLSRINIGDYVAENEFETLANYYVQTASFEEALRSNHSIFVGRKGCGKTANLFSLADELNKAKNHVCVIKPVAYEIEGVLYILKQVMNKAERGYLVESLWKFLIYTELTKSVYMILTKKPSYYEYTSIEKEILSYVQEHQDIIIPEFSERLDYAVSRFDNFECGDMLNEQKQKISELLHQKFISALRSKLGDYLGGKTRVVILVDNLDKAWSHNVDIELTSDFIFGLLDVGESIISDFSSEKSWKRPANLSLIIFLRDDIYNQISSFALEKDKLPIKKILWEDPEILLRVIEERIDSSGKTDVWTKYFCKSIERVGVKDYIINNIIPRPRDIVYLIKVALNNAVSRKHSKIESSDITDAQSAYSKYALDTLVTESGNQIKDIENFLYEFAGCSELLTYSEIVEIIKGSNIQIDLADKVIDDLCSLSFLGIEIENGDFAFIRNEDDLKRYRVMAKRIAVAREDKQRRFKIHKAFHAFLGIKAESD